MGAEAAAEGVCMAVHGYLRAVGQLQRYNRYDVLEHLDACIAQETTTKVFVNRYLAQVLDFCFVYTGKYLKFIWLISHYFTGM